MTDPVQKTAKPFPNSLCHRCAAPPRYIENARGSVFVLCPKWPSKYPPQPVLQCPMFELKGETLPKKGD